MADEQVSIVEVDDRASSRGWRALFPPAQWLPAYQLQWLSSDVVAGVTLAAYGIPVSLAYATLAGLPPQYGIYCYLVGGFFYALFGSSRQLAIGPTSAISMLVGVTVADMAGGDPVRFASIAALTAILIALMCVIAWLLRLSSLVNFISETILLGFKAGAALTIALTQLPKLFGVKGGGEQFFERIAVLAGQLPDTHLVVLAFGVGALALLVLGEEFLPGRPVALFVVVLSIVLLSLTPLGQMGFKVVGALPRGLPDFQFPPLRVRDVDGIVPLAFACLLLSYVESVSAARAIAQKNGYEIDARQELLGIGAANLAAGLFRGYPVAGGLSQSSVNDKAGAKTPLALVFASIAIGLCLMFLTGLLTNLPNVVLAAIVLVAVKGLIDIRELRHVWRVSRYEFPVSMVAFAAVLMLGILKGVIFAVLASMLLLIRRAAHPHVAMLGRIPGTTRYSDIERHPENEAVPGVLIFRVEASLLYFNSEHVRASVWDRIRSSTAPIRLVICDLSSSPAVDIAGARMLATMHADLAKRGMRLRILAAHGSARDILRAEGLEQQVGELGRHVGVDDVIEAFLHEAEPGAVSSSATALGRFSAAGTST
ncbi:SulP family sulfate permease [Paraburkholderia atlantica]|uniref:High affinity sulfate transporter 1 n=1 Tax=Paraburkholderia atlantica TaxID=2654982 RepID=A0A6I1Q2T2_PARAM|nr:SulP family inorganic anion transporter [Paraburkholderia atlantica]MBB5428936.1 high affinity sulfate transporter 1 [Paraburkholderia atlantica]MPW08411.1 sulfate permease [Paraburkholderia atlantica]NUY35681.1 SulP family inorganic anion transporter [Paraburkholderia atlantica]